MYILYFFTFTVFLYIIFIVCYMIRSNIIFPIFLLLFIQWIFISYIMDIILYFCKSNTNIRYNENIHYISNANVYYLIPRYVGIHRYDIQINRKFIIFCINRSFKISFMKFLPILWLYFIVKMIQIFVSCKLLKSKKILL